MQIWVRTIRRAVTCTICFVFVALGISAAGASDFAEPWRRPDRAIVIDAYENNPIIWQQLVTDKRITGFINKGSDGLPAAYSCTGNETERRLCKALWLRYAVSRELFHTRRTVAKALGLKWGAYHLARPGNPIDQANHFIDFTDPEPDDLLAIDIEDNKPDEWMSLEDAEEFVRHIHRRLGRFPILYTNGSTAKHIADNRDRYQLLSRLPLWYARYKPDIGLHFPKGNWDRYTLWQFSAQANCNVRRCPYRVPGAGRDIDVNVASMSIDELRQAWPFGGLLDSKIDLGERVPVPIARNDGLAGDTSLNYLALGRNLPAELAAAYRAAGDRRAGGAAPIRQAVAENSAAEPENARVRDVPWPNGAKTAYACSMPREPAARLGDAMLREIRTSFLSRPKSEEPRWPNGSETAYSCSMARQPISRLQNPPGQSISSITE